MEVVLLSPCLSGRYNGPFCPQPDKIRIGKTINSRR